MLRSRKPFRLRDINFLMNKWTKVLIAVIITVVLYTGLFYSVNLFATPETYFLLMDTFYFSIFYALISLPLGILASLFFNKWIEDVDKRNLSITSLTIIWGALFGWLTVSGLIIGSIIIDNKRKTKESSNDKKKKWFYNDYSNLKISDWLIAGIIAIILLAIPLLLLSIFSVETGNDGVSPFAIVGGILVVLVGAFLNEKKKDKKGFTGFQKAILLIIIVYLLINAWSFALAYTSIPLNLEERQAYDFENEYLSQAYYYDSKIISFEKEFDDYLLSGDHANIEKKLEEYEKLRRESGDYLLATCQKIKEESIDLSQFSSPEVQTLSILCLWEDVFADCTEETIQQNRDVLDLLMNLEEKNYNDCLEVYHPAKNPGNCDWLITQTGGQPMTSYEAEELCGNLFR